MIWQEDDYLAISGLQHFSFCRRQWALITLEQQWSENLRTTEGALLHERAHEEGFSEKRRGVLTVRGLRVQSPTLGVSGSCDVVEWLRDPAGISLAGRDGLWRPYPVEYKRGEPKQTDADRLQLCCQAMCLEEMLCCSIPEGALFYDKPRRRERVALCDDLRDKVRTLLAEMHALQKRGYTPKVKTGAFCRACSLNSLCLPKLCKSPSAQAYLRAALQEEESP
ncbi:MAG: CRISPR-associated protein Cas4 [Eubacteriales bacterium]|nr:CRISPR-associated protein Cas4 [Eubacteriales bacterium]